MATQAHGPGLSSMFDAVEMMRKTWSGMSVPSSLQPTMDIGEIDRRIADLRVVEQWLQLNQTMLQTTIQTLEIQRNTVAAFQAFSKAGAMVASAPVPSPAVSHPPPPTTPPANPSANPNPGTASTADNPTGSSIAAAQAALWWDFLQQPFRQMTEAANRHHSAGSAGHPAPTTPGAKTDPASAPSATVSTKQSNRVAGAEMGRGATTRSPTTQSADGGETPINGRTSGPKGPRV